MKGSEVNENGIVFDFGFVDSNFCGGIHAATAISQVERPAMPWTGNDGAIQSAIRKRSLAMGAGVIHRVKGAVDMKEGDGAAVQGHFFSSALGDFVRL